MRKLLLLLAVLAAAGVLTAAAGAGKNGFTDTGATPFSTVVFVDCANGGAGEDVLLTGTIHGVLHVTVDATGGGHFKTIDTLHATGVGLTTGDRYRGNATNGSEFNVPSGGTFEATGIESFRIVGQGRASDFVLSMTSHLTVNANGDVTSEHEHFRGDCK